MKPKTVILMGVAIVCGLVAALLVSMATQAKTGPEMVNVLVAAEELRQGTVLNNLPKQIVQTQLPREQVPPNAIVDPKELDGMQILRNLDKKDVLTKAKIGKYEGLDRQLPKGHRAMTIRVGMDTSVAGFILPGAKVDLLCTLQDIRNPKRKLSKIFMQDMLVLAINTMDVRQDEKGRTVGNPTTATLAVTPAQAEQLTRVVSEGTVWMVLRKPDDNKKVKTRGVEDPLADLKTDTPENAEVDLYVAVKTIPSNTAVTEANFDELFVQKKFPKDAAPADPVKEKKEIMDAKFVYVGLGQNAPLTRLNLTKPQKTEPDKATETGSKQHVLRISNGAQPVIEVVYHGNKGSLIGGQQPADAPPGPAAAPGSEGK